MQWHQFNDDTQNSNRQALYINSPYLSHPWQQQLVQAFPYSTYQSHSIFQHCHGSLGSHFHPSGFALVAPIPLACVKLYSRLNMVPCMSIRLCRQSIPLAKHALPPPPPRPLSPTPVLPLTQTQSSISNVLLNSGTFPGFSGHPACLSPSVE